MGPSRGFQSSRFMHSTHAMEIRGRRSTLKRTKTTYRIPCMGGFQNPQAPGIVHVHRKALQSCTSANTHRVMSWKKRKQRPYQPIHLLVLWFSTLTFGTFIAFELNTCHHEMDQKNSPSIFILKFSILIFQMKGGTSQCFHLFSPPKITLSLVKIKFNFLGTFST